MLPTHVLYTKAEFLREAQAGEADWASFLEAGLPAFELDGETFVSSADFDAWIRQPDDAGAGVDPLEAVWSLPEAAAWTGPFSEFAA